MDDYKGTTEQMHQLKMRRQVGSDPIGAFLELRARVEALEAAQNLRQQDEDAEAAISPDPTGSLVARVERVLKAIPENKDLGCEPAARAAILVVAAALIEWHHSDRLHRTAWEAGMWLKQQASNTNTRQGD